ncbi:hypothetical protein OG824_27135 [Streptomyces prunicolor]|uniref:hypothetical protein n=1 Tax=Streptomyces prunicolor TaxID=67348 RepID=UPI002254A060|nr:hypothetical protein [Streptomyces prunicolor]MCX5238882.1 hypothetical protein [Streptomyces prunicolor]
MRATARPGAWLSALFDRLGVCGNAGVAVGVITGFILSVLDLTEDSLAPSLTEAIEIWLILAAFGWFVLLILFTVFARWNAKSVATPALVNSVLVTALTVLVTWLTGLFSLAWLIGILAGMLIGFLLCTLYRRVVKEK